MGTVEPGAAGGRTETHQRTGRDCSRCFSDNQTSLWTSLPALNVVKLSPFSSPVQGSRSFSDFPGETSGSKTNAFIS